MILKRVVPYALGIASLLGTPGSAAGDVPPGAPRGGVSDEAFRSELSTLVEELGTATGYDAARIEETKESVSSLSAADLAALEGALERVPGWRALPEVMAELERGETEYRHRLASRAVSRLKPPTETEELETFRQDLLFFVARLEAYSPLVQDPGFDAQVSALRAEIATIPAEQLHHLRTVFHRNAPIWKQALEGTGAALDQAGAGQAPLAPRDLSVGIDFSGVDCNLNCNSACSLDCGSDCDFNCRSECCVDLGLGTVCEPCLSGCRASEAVCKEGCEASEATCKTGCRAAEDICGGFNDAIAEVVGVINQITSFLDDFFQDVEGVFAEIAALPGQIEAFFLDLGSDLEGHLLSIVDTLAGPVEELLAVSSPADALGLLGLDGLDAAFFEGLAGSVPKLDLPCPPMGADIPGIGEVGSARAEYVCKRGIDWVSHLIYDVVPDDVFDVPLKVPATFVYYPINYFCLCMEAQSTLSFRTAQAEHRDHVEARLDARLGTRASQTSADLLVAALAAVRQDAGDLATSVAGSQAGIADVDSDVAQVEAKLDVLDGKVDSIDESQDEQTAFAEAFRELVLRIRIAENLLHPPSGNVGLFQLPQAQDGQLEAVRETVAAAIQQGTQAGFRSPSAQRELERGDQAFARHDYETAYEHYRKAYRDAVKN